MIVTKKIRIDMQYAGVPPVVDVMQNDEGSRVVEISLYNGGVEFLPDESSVTIAYKKPDGTSGWYDKLSDETPAISVNGNAVTVTLAQQIASVAGNVFATIRIEDGLKRVSTFPFIVSVTADPANGSVKSENYYNVTNWDDVNSSFDDVHKKIDELADTVSNSDAVLYTKQALAAEQQAQARTNIGAAEILETVIVEEKEYDFTKKVSGEGSNGWANYSIQLIADETYRVAWGDKDYICKAKYDTELKGLYLGNISLLKDRVSTDGEPFLFIDAFPVIMWTTDFDYASLVVGVYHQYTESVRYTKQNLTTEQQAQARANIGAVEINDTAVGGDAWSSKNIVDKLCPNINESGAVVACEPVEGYPLEVTAEDGATKITRCGKNLIDPAVYMKSSGATTLEGDVFTTTFTSGGTYVNRYNSAKGVHPSGTYTVSVIPVSEEVSLSIFVYDHATDTAIKSKLNIGKENGYTLTFTADAPCRITVAGPSSAQGGVFGTYSYKLQLEVGTTATAYEPFRGETFAPGEAVTALDGVNTIFADAGIVTVTGKANPLAIIEGLTNTVAIMSETMTALTGV